MPDDGWLPGPEDPLPLELELDEYDAEFDAARRSIRVVDRRAVWLGLALTGLVFVLASFPTVTSSIRAFCFDWAPQIETYNHRRWVDAAMLIGLAPVIGLGVGLVNRRALWVSLGLSVSLGLLLGMAAWTVDNAVFDPELLRQPVTWILGPVFTIIAGLVWAIVLGPAAMLGAVLGAGLRRFVVVVKDGSGSPACPDRT